MGDFYLLGLPVSLGTMIYQAIIFTVLVILLKKFVISRLLKVFETRKAYIENQLNLSEKYKLDSKNEAILQIELINNAKKEAKEIVARSRQEAISIKKEANIEAKEIISTAKKEAARIRSLPPATIEQNKGA